MSAFHATKNFDALRIPQAFTSSTGTIAWKATYSAFGNATIDPASSITNNLRFPGQYYDAETNLHYNWNRYYDPKTGRYLTPDPIGLDGGMNLFVYVEGNPVGRIDIEGLDVNVCFYSDAAAGFGHVGFGLPSVGNPTSGFYPTGNPFSSEGIIKPDTQEKKQCKIIDSPPDKDECMQKCLEKWKNIPGKYRLATRQCTSFVRDCLKECGLFNGNYSGPRPWPFYNELPNKIKK